MVSVGNRSRDSPVLLAPEVSGEEEEFLHDLEAEDPGSCTSSDGTTGCISNWVAVKEWKLVAIIRKPYDLLYAHVMVS